MYRGWSWIRWKFTVTMALVPWIITLVSQFIDIAWHWSVRESIEVEILTFIGRKSEDGSLLDGKFFVEKTVFYFVNNLAEDLVSLNNFCWLTYSKYSAVLYTTSRWQRDVPHWRRPKRGCISVFTSATDLLFLSIRRLFNGWMFILNMSIRVQIDLKWARRVSCCADVHIKMMFRTVYQSE